MKASSAVGCTTPISRNTELYENNPILGTELDLKPASGSRRATSNGGCVTG